MPDHTILTNKSNKHQHEQTIHCLWTVEQQQPLSEDWQDFFAQQTIPLSDKIHHKNFYLFCLSFDEQVSENQKTLLEQMIWVLLTHPECHAVIWPLNTSLNSRQPLSILTINSDSLQTIKQQGFIGLFRHSDFNLLKFSPDKVLCFSHSLTFKPGVIPPCRISLLRRLKNKLSLQQKIFLKRKLDAVRELVLPRQQENTEQNNHLAQVKSWAAKFMRPQLMLNQLLIDTEQRIPLLIATHWLELGGAEKFTIDLIKALPKDRYAIYVTTDIPSFNEWSKEIIGQVEAIYHLPSFLPAHSMMIFYDYLIQSRHIRLMHIHHAPHAYNSLYHLRRFHPKLQILDSLHILELPPNNGGYVESSAQHYEAFINHHHVINYYLKNFLNQRWLVPDNKISVIYLNVNSDHFNPEQIKKGQIRQELNIPDNACLVGFLGRFSQQKQPLEFIKTAQLLQQRWLKTRQSNPLVFLMAGSGLLEAEIKKSIQLDSDTTILLHPQIQDPRHFYKDCDVLMMPSENEGLALVSYESMAMQTPIFFTNVGAQDELMEAEFLIENTAPLAEKFAQAIWPYLIDNDKRQQLGIKMRAYIQKHHYHKQTYTQLIELYRKLLSH